MEWVSVARRVFPAVCWLAVGGVAGAASLTVPGTFTASPGDTIVVPVSMRYGSGVIGYVYTLEHSVYLEFVDAEAGPIARNWGPPAVNAGSTQVTLAGAGATPLDPVGTLSVLRFRIRGDTPNGHVSPLRFTQASLNDGEVPVTTQNGTVSVSRTVIITLTCPRPPGPGETFTVDITADDATGLLGYLLRIDFQTDDFDVLGVAPGLEPQLANWGAPTTNLGPGRITLAAAGALALSGPATLATLTLRAHSGLLIGDEYTFALQVAQLNDGDIDAVTDDLLLEITDPNALPVGACCVFALAAALLALGSVSLKKNASALACQR